MNAPAFPVVLASLALACSPAVAQPRPGGPDKSGYHLGNPTPRNLWRPLSADRPDFTESPYTVDAGALQLEASFVDYARDGDDESLAIAPLNMKLGLTNTVDLQWVLTPYQRENPGDGPRADGFGDVQIRLKVNLWGNDGGDTAFAVMPYVKLPTASGGLGNDEVEGGVILPLALSLSDRVGLGLMAELDVVYDEADDDYDLDFVHTAALGIELAEPLGVYLEGVGMVGTDAALGYRALLGAGATWGLDDSTVLDAGVNVGLTGDVDDLSVFAGITVRF